MAVTPGYGFRVPTAPLTTDDPSAAATPSANVSNRRFSPFGGNTPPQANPSMSPVVNSFSQPTPNLNPTPSPAPGGSMAAYQNLGSNWNPYQYATDATTQILAKTLGGGVPTTTASTAGTGSPFGIPQQNVIDFGGGFTPNAGLMQQFIDIYGPTQAMKMFGDQAKQETGSPLGIGTNPSLSGYDPSLTQPVTGNMPNPWTGLSVNGAQALGLTPPPVPTQGSNPTASSSIDNGSLTNYINAILGNPGSLYGPSNMGSISSLLNLFGGSSAPGLGSNGNALQMLMSLFGGLPDSYNYTQPRYGLFY